MSSETRARRVTTGITPLSLKSLVITVNSLPLSGTCSRKVDLDISWECEEQAKFDLLRKPEIHVNLHVGHVAYYHSRSSHKTQLLAWVELHGMG